MTRASITEALREGPYGRCVYGCDNDVVDHHVVTIEYTGGETASLTMTAFTPTGLRRTRVFGTRGTLEGDGRSVEVYDFLTRRTTTTSAVDPTGLVLDEGHLDADPALTRRFLEAVRTGDPDRILTSPAVSLHPHATVWAAERSRHRGTVEAVPS